MSVLYKLVYDKKVLSQSQRIALFCGVTKKRPAFSSESFFSGAKESRTPDLLHAMQALYQLSYNPER